MKPYVPDDLPLADLDYKRLLSLVARANAALVHALFCTPIFETTRLIHRTGIQKPTAMGLIRQLREAGILKELQPGAGRRPAALAFPQLINIAEGRKVL